MNYIYVYGMVLATHSHLLCDSYPQADGYAEIKRSCYHLGGESGVAALILASLGSRVKLGGSDTGKQNDELVRKTLSARGVDISGIRYNPDFDGVMDNVIIDSNSRTCFGKFGTLFSSGNSWYAQPDEEAVKNCSVVGADPFFGDEIARLCKKHNKKLATIDCRHDSYICREAALIAISHEFIRSNYPDCSLDDIYELYTNETDALVIFTAGSGMVTYGRKSYSMRTCAAFKVEAVSTLGAGDSFKAGTIYALDNGMSDDETVEFACAVAATACTSYPIPEAPPTLDAVRALIATRHN